MKLECLRFMIRNLRFKWKLTRCWRKVPSTKSEQVSQTIPYLSIYIILSMCNSTSFLTIWDKSYRAITFLFFNFFQKTLDDPWKYDPLWFSHIGDSKLKSTGLAPSFQSHTKKAQWGISNFLLLLSSHDCFCHNHAELGHCPCTQINLARLSDSHYF